MKLVGSKCSLFYPGCTDCLFLVKIIAGKICIAIRLSVHVGIEIISLTFHI